MVWNWHRQTSLAVLLELTTYSCVLAIVTQAEALKEENDSLRWQLDAYRNEVELLRHEKEKIVRDEDANKEQQLKLLQQTLQGMQQVSVQGR